MDALVAELATPCDVEQADLLRRRLDVFLQWDLLLQSFHVKLWLILNLLGRCLHRLLVNFRCLYWRVVDGFLLHAVVRIDS